MKRERDWEVEDVVDGDDRGAELQVVRKKSNSNAESLKCPYLDTINRHLLDFDSEKLCSQTLSNRNVYVCLVCGKFFEGRGKATPAYIHSVDQNHYVFMNLDSGRAYCLPDSYEILDNSLSDIRKCLAPEFDRRALASLSSNTELARDVHGFTYLPGCVGLNNLTATDDLNVVLHLLSHIAPLRDFFLQHDLYRMSDSKLLQEFGLVSSFSYLLFSQFLLRIALFCYDHRWFESSGRQRISNVLFHHKNSFNASPSNRNDALRLVPGARPWNCSFGC